MRKKKRQLATALTVIQDGYSDAADVPSNVLHGLSTMAEVYILREPGTRTVAQAEVRASTGTDREGWRQATEEEYIFVLCAQERVHPGHGGGKTATRTCTTREVGLRTEAKLEEGQSGGVRKLPREKSKPAVVDSAGGTCIGHCGF